MTNALDSQVAIVTGAGRGQGRAHALALAEKGAIVVAVDVPGPMSSPAYPLSTNDDLEETVRLVGRTGTCVGEAADVRDPDALAGVVERTLDRFGRVDILLANAGIVTGSRLWEITDEMWNEMIATNLTGVFYSLRSVVPPMRERRYGRIVVTSSMAGRMGIPNLAHYAAAKWGVIGMAKSLALEVAAEGITVNIVCPCTVATKMVLHEEMYRRFAPDIANPTPEDVEERFRRINPIPQPWLVPEDVTRAVLHLVTDPGVVTGAVLEIGLGTSARIQ